ncbi:MAG TPA: hypothetical protein VN703_02825 [Candidatus Sulfopaludibacter sp.]|nr:hypothetical protein [Candidatus Sulfopaludibacter sp.]
MKQAIKSFRKEFKALKLKKEEPSVYSFLLKGEKVFVRKFYAQVYNKNRSDVKSIFVGWGINEFNTYLTLKEFRKAYSI